MSNRQLRKQLGVSEATIHRAKRSMDNPEHRALFSLPEAKEKGQALAIRAPVPKNKHHTGNPHLDLALWMADCARTGDRAMLAEVKAKWSEQFGDDPNAKKELERALIAHRTKETGNELMAALNTFGAFDLDNLCQATNERAAIHNEIIDRFGSLEAVLEDQPPEQCLFGDDKEAAENACHEFIWDFGKDKPGILETPKVLDIVKRLPEPHTLDDILWEFKYWNTLQRFRHAAHKDAGDPWDVTRPARNTVGRWCSRLSRGIRRRRPGAFVGWWRNKA